MFIRNFKILGTVVPEKFWTKNFIGEKEKWTKGMISMRMLILSYIIQVIPNVCTKFQNPKHSGSGEILDKKKFTHRHTLLMDKTKTITPTYFVCRGYNNIALLK